MSRFTVEFSKDVDDQIDKISESLGAQSKAEVIRKALGLLSYVVKAQKDGEKLIFENEKLKTRKEILTL